MKIAPTFPACLLAGLALLLPLIVHAGDGTNTSASPGGPLSLKSAIRMALENNLRLEIEGIDIDLEETRIDQALGDFDPTLNFRAVYESIENPQNQREFIATSGDDPDDPRTSRFFTEENILLESSIEGKLQNGLEWSVVAESDRLKNTLNIRDDSLFFPEYDSFVGVRLTQPLLRDFGKSVQMARVRISATDKQLASLDWHQQMRNVVAEISKAYYDLVFAREDIRIKEDAITLAKELADGNRKRFDEGTGTTLEVRQAEVAVSVREEALISARHFYRERQNALIRELYRDFDISNPPQIRAIDPLETPVPNQDKVSLLQAAIANRMEYQANLKQIEKQDIQIAFQENQALPRIDLVGTFGGNGLDGDFGGGLDDSFSRDGLQWSAGLVISIPLGARTEKARIRESQLQKRQLVLNLKQIEMDIALQIDTAASRIDTTMQRLDTAQRSADLARQNMDEEGKRMAQGVTNNFQLLASQDDFATARSRVLAARTDLSKAVIDLQQSAGTLLPYLDVEVVGPATEEKASRIIMEEPTE